MNKKWALLCLLCSIQTISHADTTFSQELKQSCGKIKNDAELGKKYYDQKKYEQAIAYFKQQAAWTAFCFANADESGVKLKQRDIELSYNNVGLSYKKLNQPQWARAWFLAYPDSSMSQFNLKQLAAPQLSQSISGLYVQHAGFGQWNSIRVKQQKKRYSIEFDGLYMGIRSLIYGPNMGSFETTMPLNKSNTHYQYEDCKISLNFDLNSQLGRRVVIQQDAGTSGCGFGHNVSANGVFIKVE